MTCAAGKLAKNPICPVVCCGILLSAIQFEAPEHSINSGSQSTKSAQQRKFAGSRLDDEQQIDLDYDHDYDLRIAAVQ